MRPAATKVVNEQEKKADPAVEAFLLRAVRNKCHDCRHARVLHKKGRCSKCACVAKPRAGNWKPVNVQRVHNAIVEGAKYHPEGIRLTLLIFIVCRHNKESFTYFQIEKFGHRVGHIYYSSPRGDCNTRYLKLRNMVIAGKVPELAVKAMLPHFTVIYTGEGFA